MAGADCGIVYPVRNHGLRGDDIVVVRSTVEHLLGPDSSALPLLSIA
jgi:hypothetical protein